MKNSSIFFLFAASACAVWADTAEKTYEQIDFMYTTAHYRLNNPHYTNIQEEPKILEECTQHGHPRAAILLLDVYEGKRKGLSAQPKKAADLAHSIAGGELKFNTDDKQSDLAKLESIYRYALYKEKGFGCEKSPHEAYEWMLKASNGGYGKARVELARYLLSGKGCKKSPRTALKLLRAQAGIDATIPNLFFYIGHIYLTGAGLPHKSPALALKYFKYGDRLNDANAINNLATMYEKGYATKKDELMALRLYKKAARLGCKEATANMQRLGHKLSGYGSDTPESVRVDNAAMQVIEALPLPQGMRHRLASPFKEHATSILNAAEEH